MAASHSSLVSLYGERLSESPLSWGRDPGVMFIVPGPIFSLNGAFAPAEPEFGFRGGKGGVGGYSERPCHFPGLTFQGATIATI